MPMIQRIFVSHEASTPAHSGRPLACRPGFPYLSAWSKCDTTQTNVVSQLPYATALAAVFIEGWIFVLLSVTGVRAAIIRLVPRCVLSMQGVTMPLGGIHAQLEPTRKHAA